VTSTSGEGVDALWDALEAHVAHLRSTGGLDRARSARIEREVGSMAAEALRAKAVALLEERATLRRDLRERRIDPYGAARALVDSAAFPDAPDGGTRAPDPPDGGAART
jgi:LAO/AO transport system kinase